MDNASAPRSGGLLGHIERLGNKLPDPIFLFIGATLLVIVLSAIGAAMDWSVQPQRPVLGADGALVLVDDGAPVKARSLISRDGIYWIIANMVRNFINFPPLGVVLVSVLGLGVAERAGLFGAFMKWMAGLVPGRLLTPAVVFMGVMSHVASDTGYIILPPLAAGLFAAVGRSPLAGIAAVFAGVAGGFSANLLISPTDTLVAPLTEAGARVLDPAYTVLPTCNWFFLSGSAILITLVGWAVTELIVEPRLSVGKRDATAAAADDASRRVSAEEARGLRAAGLAMLACIGVVAALLFIPGAPLNGPMPAPAPRFGPVPAHADTPPGVFTPTEPGRQLPAEGTVQIRKGMTVASSNPDGSGREARGTARLTEDATVQARLEPAPAVLPRWSQAIVPIILFCFLIPGIAYGVVTGTIRSQHDVAKAFVHSMQTMAPVIAMAFFAAQFIGCLDHSQLDRMLAFTGGRLLVSSGLSTPILLVGLILLTIIVDLLIASMSAKWAGMAVIVVPMMMMAGISPELTQAAYRIGDSVANIVTPLNAYIIVILAVAQRWKPDLGLGNLIAMMLPYSVAFGIAWTLFLLAWVYLGIPLGPGAPHWYTPPAHP